MADESELVVLWTTPEKETVENMLFMYALNAARRDWWASVRVIVWGASTGLLVDDEDLQGWIGDFQEAGVTVEACRACAENFDAVEDLEALGIDVFYIGERFTEYLKDDDRYVLPV
ncbi:MAG: hypothetical protein ABEJ76_08685 [Halanaeroarchaeum sp.]